MTPTYEQIERGAKAMFGFNCISKMEMPRWDVIDQGERNHWLHLAETCLLAAALPPAQSATPDQPKPGQ
jgi:hypothetical protein